MSSRTFQPFCNVPSKLECDGDLFIGFGKFKNRLTSKFSVSSKEEFTKELSYQPYSSIEETSVSFFEHNSIIAENYICQTLQSTRTTFS